jgi:hypothetical protein
MDDEALAIYRECTGREAPPESPVTEAWLIVGRRGGKSFILALIAVFLATFRDWRPYLQPGERGVVMVIARDRSQAKVILDYIKALVTEVPALAEYVERSTAEAVDLIGSVGIEVHTCSFKSIRGRTVICGVCDELAFWNTEDSAEPDTEVLNALRPAMATVPGAMLLAASSPYAKRGALWQSFQAHYGQVSPALVWKADTRTMNPTVPEALIAQAYEDDPVSAAAEYGAEFRSDVESFVPREAVEACVIKGRFEIGPSLRRSYFAFVDPSGGAKDSMTLAISHQDRETGKTVIDCIREQRPPFDPDNVCREFADVMKAFRITRCLGDRYAGEWPRERFRAYGIVYEASAKPKSDLYIDLLPALMRGSIELLDNKQLVNQLCALDRRTSRSGRDSVDHGPGGHDDLANAVAGALQPSVQVKGRTVIRAGVFGEGGVVYDSDWSEDQKRRAHWKHQMEEQAAERRALAQRQEQRRLFGR